MTPRTRALVVSVVLAGVAIAARCGYTLVLTGVPREWMVFGALTIASGFFTLKVPSIDSRLSISELFAFACVLQFGPEAGAITLAVDGIFVSIRHRLSMAQAAFNFAMLLLSVWTSGIVFFALSGTPAVLRRRRGHGPGDRSPWRNDRDLFRHQQRPDGHGGRLLLAASDRGDLAGALPAPAPELLRRGFRGVAARGGASRRPLRRDRADSAVAGDLVPDVPVVIRASRGLEAARVGAQSPAVVHRRDARDRDRRQRRGDARSRASSAAGHARARARARRGGRRSAQGARGSGAPARYRQDRGARAHPEQAREADRGGVREDEAPCADWRGDPFVDRVPVPRRADRPASPRELGRHGISGRAEGGADSARRPDPVCRGLLRRADIGPSVSAPYDGRAGAENHHGPPRDDVRPAGRGYVRCGLHADHARAGDRAAPGCAGHRRCARARAHGAAARNGQAGRRRGDRRSARGHEPRRVRCRVRRASRMSAR